MSMTETTENKPAKHADIIPSDQERTFALAQRQAMAFANSDIVPDTFRGNMANCMIALELAARIGASPLMVAQNLDVIHGRPSFRATFLIACLNRCGRFTPLRYKIEGDGMKKSCIAYAHDTETGELYEGPPVTMQMAHDEGWSTKKGSKWLTMPDLMLRYRAAAFFARTTAPEVAMGLYTADEAWDMAAPKEASTNAKDAAEALRSARDVTPAKDDVEVDEFDEPAQDVEDEFDPETGECIPRDLFAGN